MFVLPQLSIVPFCVNPQKQVSLSRLSRTSPAQIKGLNFPFHAKQCNMHKACARHAFSLSQQSIL